MNGLIVGLGACLVLSSLSSILTFAGIHRIIREQNDVSDAFVTGQNVLAAGVSELSALISDALDCVLQLDLRADTSGRGHEQ